MKAKEISAELMKNPEATVLCGAWNGHSDTYAMVDHIHKLEYGQIKNDFFGTPGRMDKRLFQPNLKDEDEVFYIGSLFGKVPNKDIDFGEDDIDYPINTINEDPYLVWKSSGFINNGLVWTRTGDGWEISYNTETQILDVNNYRDSRRFVGKVVGIETLRNIITLCNIDIWVGV